MADEPGTPGKILMVENGRGGYTRYTVDLCESLAARGVAIIYLASKEHDRPAGAGVDLRPVLQPNSPPKDRLGTLSFAGRRLLWSTRSFAAIHRCARREHPDLIHLQTTTPFSYGHLLPLLRRRWPLVLTVHDVLPHHGTKALKSAADLRRVYHAVDCIIVHSDANRATLQQRFGVPEESIVVIPHGASATPRLTEKSRARAILDLPQTDKLVAALGVLRTNKRLDLLIGAVATARRQRGDIRLVIAGRPGSVSAAAVTALLAQAGLRERTITRFGWLSDTQLGLYLDAADVCVLPYADFDAQSGVLMQALAHGAPLIVSNAGALPETVSAADAGLVFPSDDMEALTRCILRMLGSAALQQRCARNARAMVRAKLDWHIVADRTLSTYRRVCAAREGLWRTVS
jgi:glycosyltransferase involved in cell wall biosynthesis